MRTKEITLYHYDELPTNEAKDKAREWFLGLGLDEWWNLLYSDFADRGVTIRSFDIDRGQIRISFKSSAMESADAIILEWGDTTPIHIECKAFLEKRDSLICNAPRDESGDFEDVWELDQQLDELELNFTHTLGGEILSLLRQEYEYQTSEECVAENIRANEYEFTEEGERA